LGKNLIALKHFSVPDNPLVFCGMAIGYEDINADINKFKTSREALDEWVKIIEL